MTQHTKLDISDTGWLEEAKRCMGRQISFELQIPTDVRHYTAFDRVLRGELLEFGRPRLGFKHILDAWRTGAIQGICWLAVEEHDYTCRRIETPSGGITLQFLPNGP